jgi:LmbE family N-acetylglucosaminyl deacetylase
LEVLGFPDGGLARLLGAHWSRREPERSPTTKAERPPYRDAVSRSAAYDGDDLRRELAHVLRDTQPTTLAFPDPLDRHPDHHATGIFVLLALADFTRDGAPPPRLLAYLVHWPGWPPGWDTASRDARAESGPLIPPPSLPDRGLARVAVSLDEAEEARKREALALYRSQQEVMPSLLAAFVRRTEPFTVFTADEARRATNRARREGP